MAGFRQLCVYAALAAGGLLMTAGSPQAADFPTLIVQGTTFDDPYTEAVVTVSNNSSQRGYQSIWKECTFFRNGQLVSRSKGETKDLAFGASVTEKLVGPKGRDPTIATCRVMRYTEN